MSKNYFLVQNFLLLLPFLFALSTSGWSCTLVRVNQKTISLWNAELEKAEKFIKDKQHVHALYHLEKALQYVEEYGIDDEGATEYSFIQLLLFTPSIKGNNPKQHLENLFSILDKIGCYKGFTASKEALLMAIEEIAKIDIYDKTLPAETDWSYVISSAIAWWRFYKERLVWDEEKGKFILLRH